MGSITESLFNMQFWDELSQKKTIVHSIHPLVKLIVTICFLVVVIAGEKYALGSMLPLCLYPFIMVPLAEIPFVPLLKRTLFVMPFVAGIGILNPLFDSAMITVLPGMVIGAGWLSFFTLIVKAVLTIFAALILFATTGITRIASALRSIRIPKIFVLQLLLMYRYISLFAMETARIATAYFLRAPQHKGIALKAWGPLTGQMLMHALDRAQKVYDAMKLRGFEGDYHSAGQSKVKIRDMIYFSAWISFFSLVHFIDLPRVLGIMVS